MLGQLSIQYRTRFKAFHLKIPLWENMFFGKKDPKKDNNPKCKVNTLACYMLFGCFISIFECYKYIMIIEISI